MKRRLSMVVFALGILVWSKSRGPTAQSSVRGPVARACGAIRLSSSINPGSADFIQSAIDRAHRDSMGCLIVQLDTPGGLLKATRQIVRKLLAATVPVIVYVSPPGSHAGSAGAFITMAAHVAAMAPGTNIGAAHPVMMGGSKMDKESAKHLARKVEEDASAFLRAIAEVRGRSLEWAEKVVRESKALSHSEAVQKGVVDLVAKDVRDLMEKVDGRKVRVADKEWILRTAGAPVIWYEMSVKQQIIDFFADPNIAYLLMMLGMIGIIGEIYHPGAIFPGVFGAICLILAFVSFQVLPIGYGGVALIVLAVGFFIAEIYITSYGILAIGGVAALILGTIFFLDPGSGGEFVFDPSFSLSPWTVVPTALLMAGFVGYASFMVLRVRKAPFTTGVEGIVGEEGEVLIAVGPAGGKVFVHGETWNAVSEKPIEKGELVHVTAIRGLRLTVAPRKGGA